VKKPRFTEEQFAFALKQAELGAPVEEVWSKMRLSDATFHDWRTKQSVLNNRLRAGGG